jgi:hypothetical protein
MQARTIDFGHRLAHHGKPISRDRLKLALGIATDKATVLTHLIRAQPEAPPATGPGDPHATVDLPRAA